MWKGKTVSVVFPTYNEKESIYAAIQDFFDSGFVDEIVVVNNNAAEGTDEEVLKTKAKLVYEPNQGYGFAIQRGLKESSGDLVIVSEPDGTFLGKDVLKLLAYSEDFDVVFGTRTTKGYIWDGANMGIFLKWGNFLVAKFLEFTFKAKCTLSDVGCTMRLLKREVLTKLEPFYTVGGSHFGLEMMILVILGGFNYTQIPVNYCKRVGVSSVTGSKLKAFLLGLTMVGLILKYKLKTFSLKFRRGELFKNN